MKALLIALALIPNLALADLSVPRAKHYAWSVYDVSVLGGSSTASKPLGLTLPSGAVITNSWVYINTVFAASGTESLGVSCAGTQDIMAYQPVKNLVVNALFGGQSNNNVAAGSAVIGPLAYSSGVTYAGFGSVPTDCAVTVNVRGDSGYTPYTAGKATLIIEYFRL